MIYGLYVSAAGVQASSHRQDVIANNIANSETVGFKRDLAMVMERRTELAERGLPLGRSNKLLEALGGGVFVAPTAVDTAQGEMEETNNPMDVAIVGEGYLSVKHGQKQNLTRGGRMVVNHRGRLAMANNQNVEVLDRNGLPITLDSRHPVQIGKDGTITQNEKPVGRVGVFTVPEPRNLTKAGGTMLAYPDMKQIRPAPPATVLQSRMIERSNVEPSSELASLMDAQRQLEANANMIKYQDQMLSKLVNEVGKIG